MDVPGRDEAEARVAKRIAATMRALMARLLELMGDPPRLERVPESFWNDMTMELTKTLMPALQDIYQDQALEMLGELPIGVDWALVNEAAATWARDYSFNLVRGINQTTKRALGNAITAFYEQGLTRAQLESRISPLFGPVRAEMIAVTEVTRASTEGERAIARGLEEQGIRMAPYWATNHDELVCPLCAPRNGKEITDGVFPPRHVRCRCWTNYKLPKAKAWEGPP